MFTRRCALKLSARGYAWLAVLAFCIAFWAAVIALAIAIIR